MGAGGALMGEATAGAAEIGAGGAEGEEATGAVAAIGGGGADGLRLAGGLDGGAENAELGIGGGVDSRFSGDEPSRDRAAGGVGGGRPIKVGARGRIMGRAPSSPSAGDSAVSGATEAVGEVGRLDAGDAGDAGDSASAGDSAVSGATEAVGEVGRSDAGGSGGTSDAVGDVGRSDGASDLLRNAAAGMRIGCCITRVTSLESSAPQSVSMSSVDGGIDGSEVGESLVRRGGTEDGCP